MNKRTTARRKAAARPAVDTERHERLCTVCSYPEREAIEEAFLHWRTLREDFDAEVDLPSSDSIFRHAHAFGLFEQRSRNMRFALENIIEHSESVQPSADSVIRAIRACSCLNRNGKWVDPPTTHRVMVTATRGGAHPPVPLLSLPNDGAEILELSAPPAAEEEALAGAKSNRNSGKIENAATR
jgi:hypothetical protein